MDSEYLSSLFSETVKSLSDCSEMKEKGFFHECKDEDSLPSAKALEEIVELCRSLFFPGFYGRSTINRATLKYIVGVSVERLMKLLTKQIAAGLRFQTKASHDDGDDNFYREAEEIAQKLLTLLPDIRKVLETVNIAEVAGKHYKGYYQEAFGIVDFFYKMFTENVNETISFGILIGVSIGSIRNGVKELNRPHGITR